MSAFYSVVVHLSSKHFEESFGQDYGTILASVVHRNDPGVYTTKFCEKIDPASDRTASCTKIFNQTCESKMNKIEIKLTKLLSKHTDYTVHHCRSPSIHWAVYLESSPTSWYTPLMHNLVV